MPEPATHPEPAAVAAASVASPLDDTVLDREALLLELRIDDPEIAVELKRHAAGPDRNRYALAALRLGVLALRSARGQLDAEELREAGTKILNQVEKLLLQRSADLTGDIKTALTSYFDPKTGSLSQRLERLVADDGELRRVVGDLVGGEDSTLAKTLAAHVGDSSPLLKKLSPEQKDGVLNQLEQMLTRALEGQRAEILKEFSQDDDASALSRLLKKLSENQGELQADVRVQIEGLMKQFSADEEGSALSRLQKLLEEAKSRIDNNLTLDQEGSALARLSKQLTELLEGIDKKNVDFHREVTETLAQLRGEREEAERSTRHGLRFEDQLAELLAEEAKAQNDVHEHTGNRVGAIKNCKKGDFVITLGAEAQAAGANVVWEAKEDASYGLKDALAEIEEARKNRTAQVGVFVFSRSRAPADLAPFKRYGTDLVIIWDADDPSSDLYVRAAYSVARALATQEASDSPEQEAGLEEIEKATRNIEKQLKYLEEFCRAAETIQKNAGKIDERARKMKKELDRQVENLDEQLAAFRGAAGS